MRFQAVVVLAGFALTARLVLAFILAGVQIYLFRSCVRLIRSLEPGHLKERLLIGATAFFFVLINLPIAGLVAEGLLFPGEAFIYSPPAQYEWVVRPLAYLFFIWNLGSLFIAAIAPSQWPVLPPFSS